MKRLCFLCGAEPNQSGMCPNCGVDPKQVWVEVSSIDEQMLAKLDTILALLGYEDESRWVGKCMDCKHWQPIDHKTGRCPILEDMVWAPEPADELAEVVSYRQFGCLSFKEKE